MKDSSRSSGRGSLIRVKSWDEFYSSPKTFSDMVRWAATHQRMVTTLAEFSRVLEVGTGTGMLSAFLSRFCNLTASLDSDRTVIRVAQAFITETEAKVTLVQGDAFAMPFGDSSFEAAFSQGLLEHFSDADIVALVAEQLRVAPVAIASIPSLFYPHAWKFGPGVVGNERFMKLRRWQRILSDFRVDGLYYADFKVATLAGVTVPWPAHILLQIRRP